MGLRKFRRRVERFFKIKKNPMQEMFERGEDIKEFMKEVNDLAHEYKLCGHESLIAMMTLYLTSKEALRRSTKKKKDYEDFMATLDNAEEQLKVSMGVPEEVKKKEGAPSYVR